MITLSYSGPAAGPLAVIDEHTRVRLHDFEHVLVRDFVAAGASPAEALELLDRVRARADVTSYRRVARDELAAWLRGRRGAA